MIQFLIDYRPPWWVSVLITLSVAASLTAMMIFKRQTLATQAAHIGVLQRDRDYYRTVAASTLTITANRQTVAGPLTFEHAYIAAKYTTPDEGLYVIETRGNNTVIAIIVKKGEINATPA